MKKVKFIDYAHFEHNYWINDENINLRFGQAFINHFYKDLELNEQLTSLFYEKNLNKARTYILDNLVEYGDIHGQP